MHLRGHTQPIGRAGRVGGGDPGGRPHAGAMPIDQFNQELGVELDESEFETIGGLVLHAFGELPTADSSIALGELAFTVQAVEGNRIQWLSVEKMALADTVPTPTGPADEPAADA